MVLDTKKRFKLVMIPSLLLGGATNLYIIGFCIWVGAYDVIFSPTTGMLLFFSLYYLLKTKKVNSKNSFIIASYIVIAEISFHTYNFGWETGFYYYLFLLPAVFLLNSKWKKNVIIIYNLSIIIVVSLLYFFFSKNNGVYTIEEDLAIIVNAINLFGTAFIVIVIMIFFRSTVGQKEDALLQQNRELEQKNKEISLQHNHQKVLIKEIHHRVKNNLQIISSLMSLQRRTAKDAELTVLDESRRRVEAIALIHQKLYQDLNANKVDFKAYLDDLMKTQGQVNSKVKYVVESSKIVLSLDVAVPLGLIVSELLTNSLKHAFKDIENPTITISLKSRTNSHLLILRDNGMGLPNGFSVNNPTSLGTEIIGALIEQINGEIKFENDKGAYFAISFSDE